MVFGVKAVLNRRDEHPVLTPPDRFGGPGGARPDHEEAPELPQRGDRRDGSVVFDRRGRIVRDGK